MNDQRTLSKSDFKVARTCDAKLFFRENHYPDNRQSDPYIQLLARGGYMVEALAKARYPDGVQLEFGRDMAADHARTMEELKKDNVTLFEATLLVGKQLARVDILEKRGTVVRLIEVKGSLFDSAEHLTSLAEGKKGIFRGKRKPFGVLEDWRDYIEDVAFQLLLLEKCLPGVTIEPYLALLDKGKQAKINNIPTLFELVQAGERLHTARYIGTRDQYAGLDLISEVSVADEVALVRDEVRQEAARFEGQLDAKLETFLTGLERGTKCKECEYRHEPPAELDGFVACWGKLAEPKPHALELFAIGNVSAANRRPMIQWLFESGKAGLADIPVERLVKADGEVGPQAQRQRRQIEYTLKNEVFKDQQLGENLERLVLNTPLHFVDFEAARLALPYHAGMRGYGLVAFQWSCHTLGAAGAQPVHREWLNDQERWPNRLFAESLRAAIGDGAPMVTWSKYESATLKDIAAHLSVFGEDCPELRDWMMDVAQRRVVDIHQWCKDWYFHPGMKGRTSIKVVLDAIWRTDEAMRREFEAWTGLAPDATRDPYVSLPPIKINGVVRNVQEGTGAVLAYEEMMYGMSKRFPERRTAWAGLLRQYCGLDTLSMVLIYRHWMRLTGLA